MENYELLMEDFDDADITVEVNLMVEAYDQGDARRDLAALKKAFPFKPVSAEWDKTDMIKAAGLDVAATASHRKGYDKAVADFMNLVAPRNLAGENLQDFYTKANVKKAKEAAKAVKKLYPSIQKIEAKFAKGRKMAGKMKDKSELKDAKKSAQQIKAKKEQARQMAKQAASNRKGMEEQKIRDTKKRIRDDFKKRVKQKVAKINFVTGK